MCEPAVLDTLTTALVQWAETRSFCGLYELMREARPWLTASAWGAGFFVPYVAWRRLTRTAAR